MTQFTFVLCAFLVLLIPLATTGLVLINGGFSRASAVAHAFFLPLLAMALCAFVYFGIGFAWQGSPDLPSHSFELFGKTWNWLGNGPFFLTHLNLDGSPVSLLALFSIFSVCISCSIPLFAGAERWRLGPSLASSALLAGITFPLFAHWCWGGGWLNQVGSPTRFIDIAGSGCIHAVGGLTALATAWLLGPRKGKFNAHGMPAATPGHNAAYILLGCFLALQGWLGLNAAGAILFAHTDLMNTVRVSFNTLLAAIGGIVSSAFITRVRFRKPDASLCANGWISGLVASSAGCAFLKPAEAMLVGLISGTLVVLSIEILEVHLKIDDPGGAISVHAIGGLWGLLATGFFMGTDQIAPQLVGIATLLGFVFPLAYGLNTGLNRFLSYRVLPEGERQGADLSELGAGAYPEFMIYRDDSAMR